MSKTDGTKNVKLQKALKLTGKLLLMILAAVLALIILVIGGLNIAKFAIYNEYYSIKTNICKNPGLNDGFVCQGITISEKNGVVLVSGYMKDHSASRIYITTLDNDSRYITLKQGETEFTGHAGGIAATESTVYIASGEKIYTLSLDEVLSAKNADKLDVGEGVAVNNSASFVYTDDTYLYVGEFHDGGKYNIEGHENETAEGTHYAICSQYLLNDITTPVKIYSIRNKVQGICFTPDGKVVMSTSYGLASSGYYVYKLSSATDSGKTMDGAPIYYLDKLEREITGPAMAEGLDYYDGKVITLTESASNKYIFGKLFFAFKIIGLEI